MGWPVRCASRPVSSRLTSSTGTRQAMPSRMSKCSATKPITGGPTRKPSRATKLRIATLAEAGAIGEAGRSGHRQRKADRNAEPDNGKADERHRRIGRNEAGSRAGQRQRAADAGGVDRAEPALERVAAEPAGRHHHGKHRIAEPHDAAFGAQRIAQEDRRPVGHGALGHGDAEDETADAQQRPARQRPGRALALARAALRRARRAGRCATSSATGSTTHGDQRDRPMRRQARAPASAEPIRLPTMMPTDQKPCDVVMISAPVAFSTASACTLRPSSTNEMRRPGQHQRHEQHRRVRRKGRQADGERIEHEADEDRHARPDPPHQRPGKGQGQQRAAGQAEQGQAPAPPAPAPAPAAHRECAAATSRRQSAAGRRSAWSGAGE